MGETRDSAERMDESSIWEEVRIESIFLICWRAFGEEMDDMGYLAFCQTTSLAI